MSYRYVLAARLELLTQKKLMKHVSRFFVDGRQHYMVTVNPEIALFVRKYESYRKIVNASDINLTDGVGLQIASFLFNQPVPKRITGVDFTLDLCELAAKKSWPIFLLGTTSTVRLKKTADKLTAQFPDIRIAGMATGPKFSHFSQLKKDEILRKENDAVLQQIHESGAKIVFVALGAPKQEQWINAYLHRLPTVSLAIGIGGTLDYISGAVQRAPQFMRSLGMEWFFRLIIQPKRIIRILRATCIFMFYVVYWKVRMGLFYRPNVLGIIRNNKGEILLVEARNEPGIWKFPQGGKEPGESRHQAILREMSEELGTKALEIIYEKPNFSRYSWHKGYRGKYGYRGQKQDLFILDFTGHKNDIHLEDGGELLRHTWVSQDALIGAVDDVRREKTKQIHKILKSLT